MTESAQDVCMQSWAWPEVFVLWLCLVAAIAMLMKG